MHGTTNLKQLAQSLGLSQTTVSRALNGYPEVKESTRKRVRQAAQRLNYSPNARARGLATGRAMAISHVIPSGNHHATANPVFADFLAGASGCYSQHGYDVVLTSIEDEDEQRAYRQIAASGRFDGIIIQLPRVKDSRIPVLNAIGIPFVVHGRSSGIDLNYNWVDVNNKSSFKDATNLLLDLGHRRIALLNGPESLDFAVRRQAGYVEALTERGLTPDPALIRNAEMTEHFGHREGRNFLQGANPPTAFVVSSKLTGMGVRRALDERGLRMGRDVSIVTHDDVISYLTAPDAIPQFTATRSSVREAGRLVAEMLISTLNEPTRRPENVLLKTELVIGQSTGPCRQPQGPAGD